MIEDVRRLLDNYIAWLRDKTVLRQIDQTWVEITTPHIDRHNDYLQFYARKQNGGFLLTDDGYIIEDLISSGCTLDSPKRQLLLKMTLRGFGVEMVEHRLEIKASEQNFSQRKHNLIQAMLAVNDLFFLASPTIASLFYEDVVTWLDSTDIRYVPNVKCTGKSGYEHHFDFVIPKSKKLPERFLQTISQPSRDQAQAIAFKWIDTKDSRAPESRAYALLNDQENTIPSGVVDALRSYDMEPILWSQRDAIKDDLAA